MRKAEILKRLKTAMDKQAIPRLHLYHGTSSEMVRDAGTRYVRTSQEATELLRPFFEPFIEHHERMYMLLLGRGNNVMGALEISSGGLTNCTVDPKVIFGAALMGQACAIVLAHNHPSGQKRPSDEDLAITGKLVLAGRSLDIEIRDHLILTHDGYYSFADNGQV